VHALVFVRWIAGIELFCFVSALAVYLPSSSVSPDGKGGMGVPEAGFST
jgi:hypothetical protein